MENASKALLIAGSILICILLIGVGMMVFSSGNDIFGSASLKMSENEKLMFNQPFTNYEGERVSGANVRALIRQAISNNSANKDVEGKLVSISIDGTAITATPEALNTNEMSAASAKVNTGATYKVVLEYNESGLVNNVIATKNGAKK